MTDASAGSAASDDRSDTAIVVLSCDAYADAWPGFFDLWFRYWPDRPYPLYLVSNRKTFPDARVNALAVGEDQSWSHTAIRALERIPQRTVMLVLEDFYLTGAVDTARLRALRKIMADTGAACLRLVPNPAPDQPLQQYQGVGLITPGAAYRTSLQMAFWDRSALLGLLKPGESAWDFEVKGSRRSDVVDAPFLCVAAGAPAVPYRHTIRRGKWLPDAVRQFAPLGVAFDLSRRPLESRLNLWWQRSAIRRSLVRLLKPVLFRG